MYLFCDGDSEGGVGRSDCAEHGPDRPPRRGSGIMIMIMIMIMIIIIIFIITIIITIFILIISAIVITIIIIVNNHQGSINRYLNNLLVTVKCPTRTPIPIVTIR